MIMHKAADASLTVKCAVAGQHPVPTNLQGKRVRFAAVTQTASSLSFLARPNVSSGQ